jgi:hypothetical protein
LSRKNNDFFIKKTVPEAFVIILITIKVNRPRWNSAGIRPAAGSRQPFLFPVHPLNLLSGRKIILLMFFTFWDYVIRHKCIIFAPVFFMVDILRLINKVKIEAVVRQPFFFSDPSAQPPVRQKNSIFNIFYALELCHKAYMRYLRTRSFVTVY